jgi:hypothetical protein
MARQKRISDTEKELNLKLLAARHDQVVADRKVDEARQQQGIANATRQALEDAVDIVKKNAAVRKSRSKVAAPAKEV